MNKRIPRHERASECDWPQWRAKLEQRMADLQQAKAWAAERGPIMNGNRDTCEVLVMNILDAPRLHCRAR